MYEIYRGKDFVGGFKSVAFVSSVEDVSAPAVYAVEKLGVSRVHPSHKLRNVLDVVGSHDKVRVILHHAVRKDGNARVLCLFLNRDEIKVFHIRLSENVKPGKTVRENVKMFCAAENAAPCNPCHKRTSLFYYVLIIHIIENAVKRFLSK